MIELSKEAAKWHARDIVAKMIRRTPLGECNDLMGLTAASEELVKTAIKDLKAEVIVWLVGHRG